MSKACALCRERTVQCDGAQPVCGQCAEFGASVNCDYSSRAAGPSTKSTNLLQKGAACLPCRKKKKKCDAKRPHCSTCKAANKQARCLYEDDAQRNLIQSLVARTRELEERLASAELSPRNSPPLQGDSAPTSETAPAQPPARLLTDTFSVFPVWRPLAPDLSTPALKQSPRTTLEQFRDFSHIGIKLTQEASDAIAMGDFYSPHVHPALIHAAQLFGCMAWQALNRTNSLATMETFELHATVSLLTEDTKPLVILQVHNCLGVYYFVKQMFSEGVEEVRLASEFVRRHNLRFTTVSADGWDPLLEPSRESEELVCALSHLLYMNIGRYMVLGIPSDLGAEYEQEFQSIPLVYSTLSRSYLSILRARGALLLHRTRQLSARLGAAASCPWKPHLSARLPREDPPWLAEYWTLLEEVEMNLASLNPALLRTSLHPDQCASTHGLKICLIVTLTAEAELHHIAPQTHAESRQHCLNAVLKLVGIGKTFMAVDYEMLDPIMGICWTTAAKITFEESAQPMDELSAMNWATVRSVLTACVPVLAKSLPYLEVPLNQILEKAAASASAP